MPVPNSSSYSCGKNKDNVIQWTHDICHFFLSLSLRHPPTLLHAASLPSAFLSIPFSSLIAELIRKFVWQRITGDTHFNVVCLFAWTLLFVLLFFSSLFYLASSRHALSTLITLAFQEALGGFCCFCGSCEGGLPKSSLLAVGNEDSVKGAH